MLRHRKLVALASAVAIVAVLLLAGVRPDLPDPKKVITDVATALGPWTYAFVGGMAFLETGAFVGLVAPGETTVIVGGVIAAQGEVSLVPLIGLVWLCCVLGDSTSFLLGRRLGRDFLLRHGSRIRVDEQRLEHVESYFERHGGKTVLIGRFIGLVRAVAPFVAGSSGLPYRRFIPFSVIGSGLWTTIFCVLGFVFYRSFDHVAAVAGKATLGFGITVAVIAAGIYAYRRLRREEDRRALAAWAERQAARPLLRPLAPPARFVWRWVIRPMVDLVAAPVRFVRDRLPAHHLGLEVMSALAISAVGLYVFILYATTLSDHPATTPADRELLTTADDLHAGWAVDVAKLVSDLGAVTTVAALVFCVSLVLLVRGHLVEVGALIIGALVVYVAVEMAKDAIDRPRPPQSLVTVGGWSYPSAHAAYSTIWVAAAFVGAGAVRGLASRAALVAAALAIATAIGMSRIYLRVHYLSDVAGGWGLGAGILGACAAVAVVVSYIRQNEDRPARAGGST